MTIPAYPLTWPTGWKRTEAGRRSRAKFGRTTQSAHGSWRTRTDLTIAQAVDRVRTELHRMGIHDDDLVISSNLLLRLDGLPRSSQGVPADPGVAVYWTDRYDGTQPPKCMAVDRYDRISDDLAAVAATLEAMRAIERHGGAEVLNRAFAGFTALPGPKAIDWRAVLDAADPEGSYRRLRSQHHPDNGGNADEFQRVQRAWEQYQADGAADLPTQSERSHQ